MLGGYLFLIQINVLQSEQARLIYTSSRNVFLYFRYLSFLGVEMSWLAVVKTFIDKF